jgi:hypothetical protein
MRYGISLLSHPWAWEVACDYFANCGPFARQLIQEVHRFIVLLSLTQCKVVDRQHVTHDSKFEKIFRVVKSYQLVPTSALRAYAMYLHAKKRYPHSRVYIKIYFDFKSNMQIVLNGCYLEQITTDY